MARFFFHVHDEDDSRDEEGIELPDAASAEAEAIKGARAIAAEQVFGGRLNLSYFIEVADESGGLVTTVYLSDAIELTR